MLARLTKVPYRDTFSYDAPFQGESILNDLKKILLNFRPTKVFVTLPIDTNGDHQAFYLFLRVALWDLVGRIPPPDVLAYVVHIVRWPLPRGSHEDLRLEPPPKLAHTDLTWLTLELNPDEILKKKQAIARFKSQNAYNPKYLFSFVRRNELFTRMPDLVLGHQSQEIPWPEEELKQNLQSHSTGQTSAANLIQNVTYARQNAVLLIRLHINRWESEMMGLNLYLLGYKKGKDFAKMPKIRLHLKFGDEISVFDGRHPILVKNMHFSRQGDILLIEFPLASLDNPDYILTSVKTQLSDWPLETTGWRTLVLPPD